MYYYLSSVQKMVGNLETTFNKWCLLYQLCKFKDLVYLMECGILTITTQGLLGMHQTEVTEPGLRCATLLKYEKPLSALFPVSLRSCVM